MYTELSEEFRSRVVLSLQTTAAGTQAYLSPTPGSEGITLRVTAKKGNAADLVVSLKYADDAVGTNATAYPINVPTYANGVRQQPDAKAYTIAGAAGDFIVDFCLDPAAIPDGKFVGISYANSHAANFIAATMVEDVAYSPYA